MRKRTSLATNDSTNSLKSGSSCTFSPNRSLAENLESRETLNHRSFSPVMDIIWLASESRLRYNEGHSSIGPG